MRPLVATGGHTRPLCGAYGERISGKAPGMTDKIVANSALPVLLCSGKVQAQAQQSSSVWRAPADRTSVFLLCFAAGKEEGRDRKGYGKREKREKREKRKAESGGRRSWRRAKILAGNDAAAAAGSRLSYSVFTLCVCVCFATVISIKCNHALLVCVCVCVQLP